MSKKNEIEFKTQRDIWNHLSESEDHKVIYEDERTIIGFKNGKLHNYIDYRDIYCNFGNPEFWKPYTEQKKQWWELNGNKPTACWYGDFLNEETGKPTHLGFVIRDIDNHFFKLANIGSCAWRYAIPLTDEEIDQFVFSKQIKNTNQEQRNE